jgi:hypothetical protein
MDLDSFEKNGVTYFELYAGCPVCLDQKIITSHTYWSHFNNNCNGRVYIGDNGTLLCHKCGVNSHILNWKILCPNCGKGETVTPALLETECGGMSFGSIAGMCGQMVQATGIAWLQTFLGSCKKEENEVNNK